MHSTDETDSRGPTDNASAEGAIGYFVPAPAEGSALTVSLREVISELRVRRLAVSISILLGLIVSGLVVMLATPVYRAEALLAPVSSDSSQGLGAVVGDLAGLAQLAGVNLGQSDNTWISFATLESRALIEQFILDERLMPVLFWRDWSDDDAGWKATEPDDIPTLWDAYGLFREDVLRLDWNSTTQLVTLTVEWRDPVVAADWANTLVDRVNHRLATRAINEAEKSINYLNQELEKTSVVGLRQAIYNLIETQISNIMSANVHEEYAFRVIDPAAPPDLDDYVWPRPILTLVTGLILGISLGLAIVIVGIFWRG